MRPTRGRRAGAGLEHFLGDAQGAGRQVTIRVPAASALAEGRSTHSLVLVPLLMGPVIYVFAQSLGIPSIGAVATSLHISHLDATWSVTSFLLSGAALTP